MYIHLDSYVSPSAETARNKIQPLLGAFLLRGVEALTRELSSYCEKGMKIFIYGVYFVYECKIKSQECP